MKETEKWWAGGIADATERKIQDTGAETICN
jgi:hypothetical protein